MNSDIKKLFRVCGKMNLKDKSRSLIEERWEKYIRSGEVFSDLSPTRQRESVRNISQHPDSAKRQTKSRIDPPSRKGVTSDTPKSRIPKGSSSSSRNLHAKHANSLLPALKLDLGNSKSVPDADTQDPKQCALQSTGPFTFSYETTSYQESLFGKSSPRSPGLPTKNTRSKRKTSNEVHRACYFSYI